MRFGLIGLGAAGRSHLEVLANMPEVDVVGVADLQQQAVDAMQTQYGVPGTTDPAKLINDPSVEAIAIVAGDKAHHPLVLACAAAGKHVVCEKPIATDVADAREMVGAMDASGRLFCIAFNNRTDAVQGRIRELALSGTIGNLRMVRLVGLMAAPDHKSLREEMGEPAAYRRLLNICEDGKNALFDCGVHSFDYARFLTGSDFAHIEAMGYSMRGLKYPDHGVALCAMQNGIFVMIEKGFDYAFEASARKEYVRYEVIGDAGSLAWDLDTQTLKVYGAKESWEEQVGHGGKASVRELIYRGFIESVQAGKLHPWLASGLDGLRATEAAQAALDSMMQKGVVKRDLGPVVNWFEGKDFVTKRD